MHTAPLMIVQARTVHHHQTLRVLTFESNLRKNTNIESLTVQRQKMKPTSNGGKVRRNLVNLSKLASCLDSAAYNSYSSGDWICQKIAVPNRMSHAKSTR